MQRLQSYGKRAPLRAVALLLLAVGFAGGCGGSGGSGGPQPSYAGRYIGSFDGSHPTIAGGEKGTFVLNVAANGAATAQVASFTTADTIVLTGNVGSDGKLSSMTGNVETGGITYTFTGAVANNHGVLSGSGNWTATGGATGTWTAAPAPAVNPYAGKYTGTIAEDGSTVDLTVHNDCTVTGEFSPPSRLLPSVRSHKSSHVGIVDPRTGRISWSSNFSPSGSVQDEVARALFGTIDLLVADVEAAGVEISLADRSLLRALRPSLKRDSVQTVELSKIVNESGTVIVSTGHIHTGGTSVGDFNDGGYSQAYLSFDTSAIPTNRQIVEATWEITQNSTEGNPFSLGSLSAEPVSYTQRPDPGSGTYANGAVLVSNTLVTGLRRINVTDLVRNRANAARFQLRLRFPTNTNSDSQADRAVFTSGKLIVKYQ